MIHLKAIWPNNGSRRNLARIRKYEEAEKELKLTKQLLSETSDWERVRMSAAAWLQRPGGILDKREARLIQSQQYRQQGGN